MLLNSRTNKHFLALFTTNLLFIHTIQNDQFRRLSQRHFSSIRYISSLGSTCEIKKDFLQDSVICKSSGKSKSVHLWSASSQRSTHLDCPNNNLVVKTITDRQLSLSMCKSCKSFESLLLIDL